MRLMGNVGRLLIFRLENLLELEICGVPLNEASCIVTMSENCPNIMRLNISAQRVVMNQDLLSISNNLLQLEYLDMTWNRNISPECFMEMLGLLQYIQKIYVVGCRKVRSDINNIQKYLNDNNREEVIIVSS
eukprot:TRINITY_DN2635_c0_g1_i4.p2 TRINITY_DN2635_c0_g1~~TRINITY_DN2635_c0_g1_i4.p2  ORF type:complete len:132 (-),score=22.89 TRINITY_DN2635_c0_g1_i4:38-433(-)